MESPPLNLGQIAEDWVEQLCAASFLADFTIRSPMYRKADGQPKEAADVLVFFRGTLLVLQVKVKMVTDPDVALNDNDLKRAASAVGKAMNQFRAMLEAIDDPVFFTFVNGRGCELKFDKTEIKQVISLVVYGLVAPDGQFSQTALRFDQSCFPDEGIPIHLFSMPEFQFLTTVLTTFPDFLLFLETRALLHLKNLIAAQTFPQDVWALTAFEPKRLLQVIESNVRTDVGGLHHQHVESMIRQEEEAIPGYFIDWLIEQLYSGIGCQVEVNGELLAKTRQLVPAGSLEAFQRIIPELAKLRRHDRVRLATEYAMKIERAKSDGIAFSGIKFESHEEGYFILSIRGPRKDRQAALFNLARAFAHKLSLKRVIAIGTGLSPLGTADCDAMIVDATHQRVNKRLIRATRDLFGEPRTIIRPPMAP